MLALFQLEGPDIFLPFFSITRCKNKKNSEKSKAYLMGTFFIEVEHRASLKMNGKTFCNIGPLNCKTVKFFM
jgi:hypothetical protein